MLSHLLTNSLEGTHEGYPTYVAIKVELNNAKCVIKADM